MLLVDWTSIELESWTMLKNWTTIRQKDVLSIPMFLNEKKRKIKKFNSLDCKFDRSQIYLVQIFQGLGTELFYD